jgi:hypothetical protein
MPRLIARLFRMRFDPPPVGSDLTGIFITRCVPTRLQRAVMGIIARRLAGRPKSWQERLKSAAGPWHPTGARMLAAHLAHADRPVSYSTEGFVLRKGSR